MIYQCYSKSDDEQIAKRSKSGCDSTTPPVDFANEDSIFQLLASHEHQQKSDTNCSITSITTAETGSTIRSSATEIPQSFGNFISSESDAAEAQAATEEKQQKPTKHVPIDWSLNTKIRVLTLSRITSVGLRTCQEASGITSFVRCLNVATAPAGLDTSTAARFHQATMYWQHPHLPWLTLFPRSAKTNNGFSLGEPERAALAAGWVDSFRALFQVRFFTEFVSYF